MEVRYQLKGDKETTVVGVDFVHFYPFGKTIFIRYLKNNRGGELLLDASKVMYLKIYRD